ncbi:MAG: FAD-binding protein [Aeromicrobium sp.]
MTTQRTDTNWAGNVRYGASVLHEPTSVEELQEIVAGASRVRAVGSRHSFNSIADTNHAQVSVAGLPARVEIDEEQREVTVSAGFRYGELVQQLDAAGWALHNLASLPHISVAGGIATGTHGSGDRNGSLASAVSALQLVGADGELREVCRGDRDFAGMVVSLGALGVVTAVSLDIRPTFQIRQDVFEHLPWSDLVEHFDEITSAAYSVSVFTDWNKVGPTSVWLKSGTTSRSDLFGALPATSGLHPLPGIDPESTTDQLGRPGPWWDRLPHFRLGFTPSNGDELQTGYLVPRDHALAAIDAVRSMADIVRPVLLISEIRTVAADPLWLSPSHDTDCAALHFTWRRDVPGVMACLPALDDALAPFAARPHWGKLFTTTPERHHAAYPRLVDFGRLVERIDPTGTFGNALVDGWLGRSNI